MFDDEHRLGVEQAFGAALLRSVVQSDKSGVGALKDSLAEAMGKFEPDRTALPIPDRSFGGTMDRTIDKSVGDWTIIPGQRAPEDAPNVLICLIDDAGCRRVRCARRRYLHAEHDSPEVLRARIEEITAGDLNAIRLRR